MALSKPEYRSLVLSIAALLPACSNTETTSSTCDYGGGTVACVTATNPGCIATSNAADSNLETFGSISDFAGSSLTTTSGKHFQGGTRAGAFVTLPTGMTAADITLNTFFMGAVVDSATGPTLEITDTGPQTAAAQYVSLATTAPFDGIQFAVNNRAGSDSVLIYEFCGDAVVR